MGKIRWTLDTSTYSDAHLRKFRKRWWHFGRCPRCRLRYNQWFFAPNVGLFCWPCATTTSPPPDPTMPETHELPLDVIRKAWDENVKPGAQHDEHGSPWASFTCYGNEERAVKFARAILTAAREADAPELPWVTVCQLAKSVIADEGAGVAHWQRVGFPDHVIRAAVEAGAKAQRALGVPRQSDEAARIALRRDALVHLMSEMRKGPLMRWAAEDVESFTDDEYPLPARGCVTDPADEFAAALSSFVANTAYRLAHDPHGEVGPVERQALKDIKDALKSFAAGVGR